jgi:hypothetical protein
MLVDRTRPRPASHAHQLVAARLCPPEEGGELMGLLRVDGSVGCPTTRGWRCPAARRGVSRWTPTHHPGVAGSVVLPRAVPHGRLRWTRHRAPQCSSAHRAGVPPMRPCGEGGGADEPLAGGAIPTGLTRRTAKASASSGARGAASRDWFYLGRAIGDGTSGRRGLGGRPTGCPGSGRRTGVNGGRVPACRCPD